MIGAIPVAALIGPGGSFGVGLAVAGVAVVVGAGLLVTGTTRKGPIDPAVGRTASRR